MRLIENWQAVLIKAWSVRLGSLAGVFTILNYLQEFGLLLPYLEGVMPRKTFLVLALVCGVAGFVSRFFQQQGITPENVDKEFGRDAAH